MNAKTRNTNASHIGFTKIEKQRAEMACLSKRGKENAKPGTSRDDGIGDEREVRNGENVQVDIGVGFLGAEQRFQVLLLRLD